MVQPVSVLLVFMYALSVLLAGSSGYFGNGADI
jgi:hypothetical protein